MSEITFLQANISGGDAAMLALYSARYGVSGSGGFVTQWDDARGSVGFGPSLTPTDAQGPALNGADPETRTLDTSSAHALKSGLVSLFDQSAPKCIVLVSSMGSRTGVTVALANAGASSFLTLSQLSSTGLVEGFANYGGSTLTIDGSQPLSVRRRLAIISDETTLQRILMCNPLYPNVESSTAAGPHSSAASGLWVGQNSASQYATEHVRAVLILNRVHTSADVTALITWAATYHGAVTGGPKMVCDEGDSITAAYGVTDQTQGFAALTMEDAWASSFDNFNDGVAGSTIANLTARSATVDGLFNGTQTNKLLNVLVGINDLAANRSPATIEADLWAYLDARKAATPGLRVSVGTVIPAKWAGGGVPDQATYDANRDNLNARIRANYAAHVDAVVDYCLDAPFNSDSGWSDPAYGADNIHPSASGHLIMYNRRKATVQALATALPTGYVPRAFRGGFSGSFGNFGGT